MTFTEYCAKNNIQLLREDIAFLRQSIRGLPKGQQKAIVREYLRQWMDAMGTQNEGRRAANLWLLQRNISRRNARQ